MIGIYKIVNKENGKVYVGKTSRDIKERWNKHKRCLRNGIHENPYLQNAWNKHKEENFIFLIQEECLVEELKEKEEHYIELYRSYDREKGYNIERYSQGKRIVSEETRKKSRESHIGIYPSEETRKKLRENSAKWNLGKHHSEETIRKISESRKGKTVGENNPASKLTLEQAREIRQKYIPEVYSLNKLAKEYKVSKKLILLIIQKKNWVEE